MKKLSKKKMHKVSVTSQVRTTLNLFTIYCHTATTFDENKT